MPLVQLWLFRNAYTFEFMLMCWWRWINIFVCLGGGVLWPCRQWSPSQQRGGDPPEQGLSGEKRLGNHEAPPRLQRLFFLLFLFIILFYYFDVVPSKLNKVLTAPLIEYPFAFFLIHSIQQLICDRPIGRFLTFHYQELSCFVWTVELFLLKMALVKKVTISCATLILLYSICTKGSLSLEKLMTNKNILSWVENICNLVTFPESHALQQEKTINE